MTDEPDPLRRELDAFLSDARGENPTAHGCAGRPCLDTMNNLLLFGGQVLNSGAPAPHALHGLACTVPRRKAAQWSAAMARCEDLFDQLDGGETLGLDDGGIQFYPHNSIQRRDFTDPDQVADAMWIAAAFFRVPSLYGPALGAVVADIMRAMDKDWAELPRAWADCYNYVVACICERVGASSDAEVQP